MNYVDYGESRGDARPVVLVHGLAACWQCWLEQIPRLAAEGRRVIALDLPGFGASEMPRDDISIAGYGRTVESLIDHLDLGQVVVVGHSMGGFTAAEFAIQYPERVERLVLEAAAGISTNNLEREPLLAGARLVAAVHGTRGDQEPLSGSRGRGCGTLPCRWRSATRAGSPPTSRTSCSGTRAARASSRRSRRSLATTSATGCRRSSARRCWSGGARTCSCPRSDADEYERVIPNSRKVVFEDTGHSPMMERPQTFNDLLVDFLGEEAAERPSERELEDAKRAGGEEPLSASR